MNRFMIKSLMAAAMAAALVAPVAQAADITQDVVRTQAGNPVYDSNGGCVRTKWESGDSLCANAFGLEERTVYFAFDSAELDAAARAKLDNLSAAIRRSNGVVGAKIVGFADRIGNAKYNVMLSRKRAETVAYYLASKGVLNASVADVQALGASNSRANCPKGKLSRKERIACLAPDRRVEIELQYAR